MTDWILFTLRSIPVNMDDLKNQFNEIKGSDSFTQHLAFCKLLKTSNEEEMLNFHYALLKEKDLHNALHQMLRRELTKRGAVAEDYLLQKFEEEEDNHFKGDILQMLGGMKYERGKRLKETANLARANLNNDHTSLRYRSIIVLGWLGGSRDIDLLSVSLFKDENNENRGWAATAMMQIYFDKPKTADKSLKYLQAALHKEEDYFALKCILTALQEISGKKLGLAKTPQGGANQGNDIVDKARKKALKLFSD